MKKFALSFMLWLCVSFPALAANPQIEFQTNMGSFVIELYPDKAPKTVENFMQYVKSGYYEGTIFHRVIDKFIIQGGGLTQDMVSKPTFSPVAIESQNGLRNEPGSVAHVLVMTATPIPRSLSMTLFGDLDVSVIDGLPPGRKPVRTRVVSPADRHDAYAEVRTRLDQKEQAFIVTPAIDTDDSQIAGVRSLMEKLERWEALEAKAGGNA